MITLLSMIKKIKIIIIESLKILLASVIVLGMLETYYRFTSDDQNIGLEYTHPKRNFAYRANFKGVMAGEAFQLNSLGMRDYEREINFNKDAFRIAIFGDSLTFGNGVTLKNTFPKILENKLKDDISNEIQVFNFGVGGYNTTMEYIYLQEIYENFKPDLVLFVFYTGNDTYSTNSSGTFLNNDYRIFRFIKDQLRSLHVYGKVGATIISFLRSLNTEQFKEQDAPENFLAYEDTVTEDPVLGYYHPDFPGWIEAQGTFRKIVDFSKANQFDLAFAITSHVDMEGRLFDASGNNKNKLILNKLTEAMEANGVSNILILDDSFEDFIGNEDRILPKELSYHFSPLAGEIVAESLYQFIIDEEFIDIPLFSAPE